MQPTQIQQTPPPKPGDPTTPAVVQKLQPSGLTPQPQTTAPQSTATVAATAPTAVPLTDAQKIAAPKQQVTRQADPVPTLRVEATPEGTRPIAATEPAKTLLPTTLATPVEPKPDAAAAPKSAWQSGQDAQPNFLAKPATSILAPVAETVTANDAPETASRSPSELLQPSSTTNKDLTTTTPAQAAAHKGTVSKPFSEALMMQGKAAEVVEGRTSVHLHPRGLGNIDVEVIAGDKDLASKIIVRVENPVILQHLREDRHLLAQAIGASDGALLEFHERGAEQEQGQSHQGGAGFGQNTTDTVDATPLPQHADILLDDRIDILT